MLGPVDGPHTPPPEQREGIDAEPFQRGELGTAAGPRRTEQVHVQRGDVTGEQGAASMHVEPPDAGIVGTSDSGGHRGRGVPDVDTAEQQPEAVVVDVSGSEVTEPERGGDDAVDGGVEARDVLADLLGPTGSR